MLLSLGSRCKPSWSRPSPETLSLGSYQRVLWPLCFVVVCCDVLTKRHLIKASARSFLLWTKNLFKLRSCYHLNYKMKWCTTPPTKQLIDLSWVLALQSLLVVWPWPSSFVWVSVFSPLKWEDTMQPQSVHFKSRTDTNVCNSAPGVQ